MYFLIGTMGVVSIFAPFLFSYSLNVFASYISIITGMSLIFLSSFEDLEKGHGEWEYWISMILGGLIIFAPFLLGYTNQLEALWVSIGIGLIVMSAALSKLFPRSSLR